MKELFKNKFTHIMEIYILYVKVSPRIVVCNYAIEGSVKKNSVGSNIEWGKTLKFFMKSVKKIYKILKTNSFITLKNLPGHGVCLLQKWLNFNEDKAFNLLFFHFYITRVLRTYSFVGNRAEERNTQVAPLVGIIGSYLV